MVLLIGSLILGLLGTMLHRFTSIRLPWNMDSAFVGELFIYMGYLFGKYKDNKIFKKIFDLKWYCILCLFIINYYTASLNHLSMWKNFYQSVPLFFLNAVLGIVICFNTAKKIDGCKAKGIQLLARVLNYIGRYSIVYLCMNKLVLYVEKKIMVALYGWPTGNIQYLVFAILVVSALIVMSGMSVVYYKGKTAVKMRCGKIREARS